MTTPTPRKSDDEYAKPAGETWQRALWAVSELLEIRSCLERDLADAQEWREAVLNELIVAHIYNKEHDTNPRKAIHDAITWNCQVALDPAVSSDAQKLIAAAQAELAQAQEANEQLRKERDAAFSLSRCECESEECCRNLVKAQEARQRAEAELASVKTALVYTAHQLHGTPQFQLCKGVTLIGRNGVRVAIEGVNVEAFSAAHPETP